MQRNDALPYGAALTVLVMTRSVATVRQCSSFFVGILAMPKLKNSKLLALQITALIAGVVAAAATSAQDISVGTNATPVTKSHPGQCWHYSDWMPMCDETCERSDEPVAVAPPLEQSTKAAVGPAAQSSQNSISVSADALFFFNDSALQAQGLVLLEDLARQLNEAGYNHIYVTGHADRVGDSDYNQRLSTRRANSVKRFLVSKSVVADRIVTAGKGATQPVTRSKECSGAEGADLIACLQPDRRVEVAMHGIENVTSLR